MSNKPAIAIHGGSGTILKSSLTPELEKRYRETLNDSLEAGKMALFQNKSAIEAISAAICVLEDSPLFNAGKGSVFGANGVQEMDASIMDGKTKKAGAVAMIQGIKNPVTLAKQVMNTSEHVFLAGEGAMNFAKNRGFVIMDPEYFYDEYRFQQWQKVKGSNKTQLDHSPLNDEKFGTVGAVALDQFGNLAAATSTGGMTNKKYGRIGDSPMIGAGTYANNETCAVSCTGSGEFFIRGVVAYDVSCLIEYKGLSLNEACRVVIQERLKSIDGDGGLIAIDVHGNICLEFNTEGMYRAKFQGKENKISIFKEA